jgi:hypothetical protein
VHAAVNNVIVLNAQFKEEIAEENLVNAAFVAVVAKCIVAWKCPVWSRGRGIDLARSAGWHFFEHGKWYCVCMIHIYAEEAAGTSMP